MAVREPNHSRETDQLPHRKWFLPMAVLMVGGVPAIVAVMLYLNSGQSHDELLKSARRSFLAGEYESAETFALQALAQKPQAMPAAKLAAESAAMLGNMERAVDYFEQIPDTSALFVEARCTAGALCVEHQHVSLAVDQFLRAIRKQPDHVVANHQLAFLYGMACRNYEALPYRIFALRQDDLTVGHVFAVALGDDFRENPEVLLQYYRSVPSDPAAKIGLARAATTQKQYAEARQLLEDVVQPHPDLIEAQVNLGRVLLELKRDDDLKKWHADLSTAANVHPGIWTVLGAWAQRQGNSAQAVRCWAEAVLRDPNLPDANYQLGQLLVSTGHEQMAQPFLQRSERLRNYVNICYGIVTQGGQTSLQSVQQLREAAEAADALGLISEAHAWTRLTLESVQSLTGDYDELTRWANENLTRLSTEWPASTTARAIPDANPAADFPLASFPPFDFAEDKGPAALVSGNPPDSPSLRFRNDARRTGLDFTYFNDGAPLGEGRHRMFEFTGGGVGAIDLDRDGSIDLFLTQGCRWPPTEQQTDHLDALFRNLGDGRFQDVTSAAGIREDRFSQGVSVGDFDNDGFPDIYVANIGGNRLFGNNGDGTFRDLSELMFGDQALWTTSCLLADLNGDSLPDIYSVNYLGGDDVFTRVCTDVDGAPQMCLPQYFAAAQDQAFLNLGDGQFAEVTDEFGLTVPNGKGLGIIAADFQSTGDLGLFVANDEVPNFWFVPSGTQGSRQMVFTEQALSRGLALNRSGQAEACMGIAVGDADNDGLLDLFVTNFEHESNTLYLQQSGMLFQDATDQFGLGKPSLPMLGFGTQFLDADSDGDLDLIVTNGHIQQTGHERMPPQLFDNDNGRRFHVMPAEQAGAYFQDRYLGRGLARLDWNGDGREDVAISHLDQPAALLTNVTKSSAHRLCVRLTGVSGSRDAVGATVTVRLGKRTIVRQLTAGDGYLASNERLLTFGLGTADHVRELHVLWPSGTEATFANLPADAELLLIEHRPFYVLRSLLPE